MLLLTILLPIATLMGGFVLGVVYCARRMVPYVLARMPEDQALIVAHRSVQLRKERDG